MVDAHLMQDRGVQVVDIDLVAHDRFADVVGLAVDDATFDAAAGQPDRKAIAVMAASELTFFRRRTSKFGGPHDQRFVQHAALFQVSDQGRQRLIGGFG